MGMGMEMDADEHSDMGSQSDMGVSAFSTPCASSDLELTLVLPLLEKAMNMMVMYLHTQPGDTLWFLGWAPTSAGAMIGACLGLFLLAVFERLVATGKVVMAAHWATTGQGIALSKHARSHSLGQSRVQDRDGDVESQLLAGSHVHVQSPDHPVDVGLIDRRRIPPFALSRDLVRGLIHAVHATLGFALMLAVMTYQVGFILSIIVGAGVGEVLFGRFSGGRTDMGCH
ncbi:hypothetical protein ONZ45_g11726 [Pleurotus djamor]|nr:hypothetical protein ONZ45_g11726 [Pleurotus djamor]